MAVDVLHAFDTARDILAVFVCRMSANRSKPVTVTERGRRVFRR